MSEIEQLREALASAKQIEAALIQRIREQDLVLGGLQAVMNAEDPGSLMRLTFDVLREAVTFDTALVLAAEERCFTCTDATDPAALGIRWCGGGFFRRIADGHAAVVPANGRIPDWASSPYAPPPGSGLYVPIQRTGGRGLLVLCSAEHGRFSAKDLALAKRLSLLISESIAARQRRALADEARAAVAANEAKSRFLANMSHEIRTPLNGIGTVAEVLAKTALSPRQSEMVEVIRSSGSMLEGLLNDVLDFAKIEAGQLTVEQRAFDLRSTLSATFDLFAAKADEKGLLFETEIEEAAAGWIEGDDLRVRQVLGNLLGNAVKFTERGGIRVHVGASVISPESPMLRIDITVRDTGIGFPSEIAERLFSRFEQADPGVTREFGGTGLGLAISRSFARLMGGDVTGTGEAGKGAEFRFTFDAPRAAARAPVAVAPVEAPPALRVLVAEDNPLNQKIFTLVLEAIGGELVFVANGREALDAIAASRFDIVLMDLQMPVMDGITALRLLRQREAGAARLPVVAVSANAMTHHVEEALAAGADAHIAKPIDPSKLLATMMTLCAGRRQAA